MNKLKITEQTNYKYISIKYKHTSIQKEKQEKAVNVTVNRVYFCVNGMDPIHLSALN